MVAGMMDGEGVYTMVMVSTISIVEKMRGSMGETEKNQRKNQPLK